MSFARSRGLRNGKAEAPICRLAKSHRNLHGSRMTPEGRLTFPTREYRGCGIRVASYKKGPESWVPEACFWLHTEGGWRRLWIGSFAHCFSAPGLSFSNKIEADHCAIRAAQTLIDKTLSDFAAITRPINSRPGNRILKLLTGACRSFASLKSFKEFKHRA